MFQLLDLGVLEGYLAGGVTARADGTVSLSCTPEVEADTYNAVGGGVWQLLPGIDAKVDVCVGGDSRHLDAMTSGKGTVSFCKEMAQQM